MTTQAYQRTDTPPNFAPRPGGHHRALVRWVRAVEGDAVATLNALEALTRLQILIAQMPLTATARSLVADYIHEVHEALALQVWPVGTRS